jgi:hypothetical protein
MEGGSAGAAHLPPTPHPSSGQAADSRADAVKVPTPRAAADRAESLVGSLRRLHGLVRAVNEDLDLDRTLAAVCLGLVEGLGFGVAVINLVRSDGDLEVVACEGDDDARAAMLGQSAPRATWDVWMAQCDEVGSLLIDYRHVSGRTTSRRGSRTSRPPPSRVRGTPEDALLAPLRTGARACWASSASTCPQKAAARTRAARGCSRCTPPMPASR